jgi:nucleotide-binding universal stress UspA family protein
MPRLQRILVPIDFSVSSENALRRAMTLAKAFGARVDALHVWEPSPYVSPTSLVWLRGEQRSFWEHMKRELEEKLTETVARVAKEEGFDAAAVRSTVVSGYTSETILSTIEEEEFDMVVMGTHGRTGLSHVLLGSVAERIIRIAPCPVMTIKTPAQEERSSEPEIPKGFETPTML